MWEIGSQHKEKSVSVEHILSGQENGMNLNLNAHQCPLGRGTEQTCVWELGHRTEGIGREGEVIRNLALEKQVFHEAGLLLTAKKGC